MRMLQVLIISLVVFGFGSCVSPYVPVPVPDELPEEILAILANPEAFAANGHALRTTPVGTSIDGIDAIDGCWGTYVEFSAWDTTGATWNETWIRVLMLDRENGLLTHYQYGPLEPRPGPDVFPRTTVFIVDSGSFRVLCDNRIERTITDTMAGGVTEDGEVVRDVYATVYGEINRGARYETLITVDGDYLKTLDGGNTVPPEELPPEAEPVLWVRMSCQS